MSTQQILRGVVRLGAFALLLLAGGCAAWGDPSGLRVEGDFPDQLTIDWDESNAMGFYITDPEAKIPDGPDGHVKGMAYWVIEATDFPDGFAAPIQYPNLPRRSKNATEEHGGPAMPPTLQCDVDYKLTVIALRGDDQITVRWDCEE